MAHAVQTALRDAQRQPRDAAARHRLAMVYHAHAIREPAADCYEQTIALRPGDAAAWYRLGLVREQLAESASARRAFERAVELAGDYAPAHWRLGFLELDAGRLDEAETFFRQALALEPSAEAARFGLVRINLLRNENEKAVEALQDRLIDGKNRDHAMHLLGVAYRQAGRTEDARAVLTRRPTPETRWVDPWFHEVQALRVSSEDRERHAEELVVAGRFTEALPLLKALAEERPPTQKLLNKLAVAQIECDDPEAGLATLTEARRMDPQDAQTQVNLALAHLHLAQADKSRAKEALRQADRSVELASDSSRAHQLRAHALLLVGRADDALAEFKTAYRLDGRDGGALSNAARVEVGLRRFEDAARTLRWLDQAHPIGGEDLLMLALADTESGRLKEAQVALEKLRSARTVSPDRLAILQAGIDRRRAAAAGATSRPESPTDANAR